jgi:hypothetical protein
MAEAGGSNFDIPVTNLEPADKACDMEYEDQALANAVGEWREGENVSELARKHGVNRRTLQG